MALKYLCTNCKQTIFTTQEIGSFVVCKNCGAKDVVPNASETVEPREALPYFKSKQNEDHAITEEIASGNAEIESKEFKKPGCRDYALALIVCFGILLIYNVFCAAMGWKYGGGAIPMLIVVFLCLWLWRKIVKVK